MMQGSMEARLLRLEAEADLHRLKAEYAAAADAKYLPSHRPAPPAAYQAAARRQADCFTEDAVWEAGAFGGTLRGRPMLLAFFEKSPWQFATHLYTAPRLTVRPDDAEGEWRLWQLGLRTEGGPLLLTGRTKEFYAREQGAWRIARMIFIELHQVELAADRAALRCLLPERAA